MTVELKPCPFCGDEAHLGHHSAYSVDSSFDFVGCKDCGCMIEYDEPKWNARKQILDDTSRAEAIAAWNTRATPDPLSDPRMKALVEALTLAANRLQRRAVDFDTGSREFIETSEWATDARAALRAIEEGGE